MKKERRILVDEVLRIVDILINRVILPEEMPQMLKVLKLTYMQLVNFDSKNN